MCAIGTYAVVVDGAAAGGAVSERVLGDHDPGVPLAPSVTVVSSTVTADGRRTVVLSRPLAGLTPQHYSFDARGSGVQVISAVGAGAYSSTMACSNIILSV